MLLRMDQAGMKSLPLGKINLHKLSNMNPDAKGHLEKIVTASQLCSSHSVWTGRTLQLPTPKALVHGMLLRWGQVHGFCGH